MTKTSAL